MARPSTNRSGAPTKRASDAAARARGQDLTETIAGNTGNTLERTALMPGAPGQDGQASARTGQATAAEATSTQSSGRARGDGATATGDGSAAGSEKRRELIALAAYYRAERRGFAPGYEVEDWLEAEREIVEKEGATSIG